MPALSPEILGPLGLTIAACIVAVLLWREHLKADADDRADLLAERDLLRLSLLNNAAAISAWNKRIDQDTARQRRADK